MWSRLADLFGRVVNSEIEEKIRTFITMARGRLIFIGIVLGAAFWLIESVMHVYVFHRHDFVDSIFFPELHEAWMRLIIVGTAIPVWSLKAHRA
jgi:hypothetical protein